MKTKRVIRGISQRTIILESVFDMFDLSPTATYPKFLEESPEPVTRDDFVTISGFSADDAAQPQPYVQYVISPNVKGDMTSRYLMGFSNIIDARCEHGDDDTERKETPVGFLLDSQNKIRLLDTKWFSKLTSHTFAGTLFKIVSVFDKASKERINWIVDCISMNGHHVWREPYHYRMAAALEWLKSQENCQQIVVAEKIEKAEINLHVIKIDQSDKHSTLALLPFWRHNQIRSMYSWILSSKKTFYGLSDAHGIVFQPLIKSCQIESQSGGGGGVKKKFKWQPFGYSAVVLVEKQLPNTLKLSCQNSSSGGLIEHCGDYQYSQKHSKISFENIKSGYFYKCHLLDSAGKTQCGVIEKEDSADKIITRKKFDKIQQQIDIKELFDVFDSA